MLPSECLVSQSNVSEDFTCDDSSRQSSSDYDNSSSVYTAMADISQRHIFDGRWTLLCDQSPSGKQLLAGLGTFHLRQFAACHVLPNTSAGIHSPNMDCYFNDLPIVVWSTTQRQALAQLSNMELSSTTSPAAYCRTTAGTRLHRLVNNPCLSRHGDGRHRCLVFEVDLVALTWLVTRSSEADLVTLYMFNYHSLGLWSRLGDTTHYTFKYYSLGPWSRLGEIITSSTSRHC